MLLLYKEKKLNPICINLTVTLIKCFLKKIRLISLLLVATENLSQIPPFFFKSWYISITAVTLSTQITKYQPAQASHTPLRYRTDHPPSQDSSQCNTSVQLQMGSQFDGQGIGSLVLRSPAALRQTSTPLHLPNIRTNLFNVTAASSPPVLGKMVETVSEILLLHEIYITGQRINLILAVEQRIYWVTMNPSWRNQ